MDSYLKKFILFIKFELRLSHNTVTSYQNDLSNYLFFLKDKKSINNIESISYQEIRSYISNLSKENKKPSSINRCISSIKKFHLYLFDNEITSNDPSELLELQKNIRNLPDTLTVDEIESIIDAVDINALTGLRDISILTLLYSTGIRVSELINLEFSNIFLEEDYIKIFGKGRKERLVPIGAKAKKYIVDYMNIPRISIKDKNIGNVYLSYRSKPLTRMAVFNIIKKYCLNSGLNKKVSPHTFRHSFATHMLEGGADLRIVQEILGHENINTTEIYTHLDRTYLKEVHKLCHPRG
tara:strand:- start:166 stop:1053 length:888 start_codon:yes stop_codon:yes gene_type:complete